MGNILGWKEEPSKSRGWFEPIEPEATPIVERNVELSNLLIIDRQYPEDYTRLIISEMNYLRIFQPGGEDGFIIERKIALKANTNCLVYHHERNQLVTSGSYPGRIYFWNIPKYEVVRVINSPEKQIKGVVFLDDVSFLFYSSYTLAGIHLVHDLNCEEPEYTTIYKGASIGCCHRLKTKRDFFVFGGGLSGGSATLRLADLTNRTDPKLREFQTIYQNVITCLNSIVTEENTEYIISGSLDHRIIFWDIKGRAVKMIDVEVDIRCMAELYTNRSCRIPVLLFGGEYGKVIVLDLISGKMVYNDIRRNMGEIEKIRVVGKNRVVTCCSGKLVRLHKVTNLEASDGDLEMEMMRRDEKERSDFVKKNFDWKLTIKLFS